MHKAMSLGLSALLLATLFAGSAGSVQARGPAVFGNGPIIIEGPIDCERKLVKKCRWVGKQKICEWVPDCEIY